LAASFPQIIKLRPVAYEGWYFFRGSLYPEIQDNPIAKNKGFRGEKAMGQENPSKDLTVVGKEPNPLGPERKAA
jgi:hypothetical protein